MKRIMMQISVVLFLSIACFLSFQKLGIASHRLVTLDSLNVFFTAITVLFSIGMSTATGIDLSNVVNNKQRSVFVNKLKLIVMSLCIYFTIDCVAMFLMTLIAQIFPNGVISNFVYTFSMIAILFSILYFLSNFVMMYNFKRCLEDLIFAEKEEK